MPVPQHTHLLTETSVKTMYKQESHQVIVTVSDVGSGVTTTDGGLFLRLVTNSDMETAIGTGDDYRHFKVTASLGGTCQAIADVSNVSRGDRTSNLVQDTVTTFTISGDLRDPTNQHVSWNCG